MGQWLNAKLWIGKEVEGKDKGLRLFVDGASTYDILYEIENNPDITAIYFGHEVNWDAIERLLNKIRIIVETDNLDIIPKEFIGHIEVIYRIPNWVTPKRVFGDIIEVGNVKTKWEGQKVYKNDKVIL